MSARYRDYARHGALVYAGTHGNELAVCQGLHRTVSELVRKTMLIYEPTSLGYGFVVAM